MSSTELHAPRPVRRFTVDEVERMVEAGVIGEDEPIELLDGELVIMSPQGPRHSTSATDLRDRLLLVYREGFVVREAKPLIAGKYHMPEPDLAVVRRRSAEFRERHPRGDEAVLVVELANTSQVIDRSKARAYAQARVPVYWLVDLVAGPVEGGEDPHPDGRYPLGSVLSGDDELVLPGTGTRWRAAEVAA